jgi:hypothetical protein
MHPSPSDSPAAAQGPWRRTIFLGMDSGVAIRNILRTDVFAVLKAQPWLRIVIFGPLVDDEFRREVAGPNVFVEKLPQKKEGPILAVLASIKKEIWADKAQLFTFGSKRLRKRGRGIRDFFIRTLCRIDSADRIRATIAKIRNLEKRFAPAHAAAFFDRYQPDLLFTTTLYSRVHNLEWLAKQRGIPCAAFVLSWDNPTSKGPFPVRPERVILWNEILRQELITYHDCTPEELYVSGVPQFDIYAQHERYRSREEFFKRWNLDPALPLVTYTTGTPGTAPFDDEVVELLYQRIQQGALRQKVQLLVRLHPKDKIEFYRRFEGLPGLVLQLPGRAGSTADSWNPTHDDMYGLAELMKYTAVNVNVASTITIDAAAFDTPVVNVAFDGKVTKPYLESCVRYYDYEHYKRIVDTGGVRIARNPDEMMQAIQAYLDDPSLEAAGRERIRREQCWKLDGHSGRRIAEYLIRLMGEEPVKGS